VISNPDWKGEYQPEEGPKRSYSPDPEVSSLLVSGKVAVVTGVVVEEFEEVV
jgi:hypothetical protein